MFHRTSNVQHLGHALAAADSRYWWKDRVCPLNLRQLKRETANKKGSRLKERSWWRNGICPLQITSPHHIDVGRINRRGKHLERDLVFSRQRNLQLMEKSRRILKNAPTLLWMDARRGPH